MRLLDEHHLGRETRCQPLVVVMGAIMEAHVDATPRERTHGHVLGEDGILI